MCLIVTIFTFLHIFLEIDGSDESSSTEDESMHITSECPYFPPLNTMRYLITSLYVDEVERDVEDDEPAPKGKSEFTLLYSSLLHCHIYYSERKGTSAKVDQRSQNKGKGKKSHYTPEPESLASLLDDPALLTGYPDWSLSPEYYQIYAQLEKVDIPNRPPTLPTIYQYRGTGVHPLRHLYTNADPANTYVYVFDSEKTGATFAKLLSYLHGIPQGPTEKMKNLGTFCNIFV